MYFETIISLDTERDSVCASNICTFSYLWMQENRKIAWKTWSGIFVVSQFCQWTSTGKKLTVLIVFFKHVIYNSLLCHASYDCEILFITHCYIRQHFSSAYIWFYVVPSNGKNHSTCFVASPHSWVSFACFLEGT